MQGKWGVSELLAARMQEPWLGTPWDAPSVCSCCPNPRVAANMHTCSLIWMPRSWQRRQLRRPPRCRRGSTSSQTRPLWGHRWGGWSCMCPGRCPWTPAALTPTLCSLQSLCTSACAACRVHKADKLYKGKRTNQGCDWLACDAQGGAAAAAPQSSAAPAAASAEELAEFSVTDALVEFVSGLTYSTFRWVLPASCRRASGLHETGGAGVRGDMGGALLQLLGLQHHASATSGNRANPH